MTASCAESLRQRNFGVVTGHEPKKRLSESTRLLAARYLSGEIGRTMDVAHCAIDPDFFLTLPSANRVYAEAIRLIATHAPLRIEQDELLVGAATLREATWHRVPLLRHSYFGCANFNDAPDAFRRAITPDALVSSVSHTTLGFDRVLAVGYAGIRRELEARLNRVGLDPDARDFLESMRSCLDAADIWHARYLRELDRLIAEAPDEETRRHFSTVQCAAERVPANPPQTFHEALQALWLAWDFQRLCGNWSGLGRFDRMLGPFLWKDLADGRITLDDARELIAHFWIKGCEWITADGQGSGDAQFYQNIVLAGVDETGNEIANEVTDLVLDVVEELHISDFPIAVRVNSKTPRRLLERIARIQRLGGGIVAIYNEDRIIPTLTRFGYPLEEARSFANDGCWELLIPGKTCFAYQPFDALKLLQDTLGLGAVPLGHEYPDFESLYAEFRRRLAFSLTSLVNASSRSHHPTPLVSLLVDGCIESARSYYDLGPKYTVLAPHPGGLPDVANSLLAIRELVYSERRLDLRTLVDILRADWEGHEPLRQSLHARGLFYGNGHPVADAMMQRVFDDFTALVAQVHDRLGILRPAGISTFGREATAFLPHRYATACGQKKWDVLASNFSPTPGTDTNGPTAIIRSHCAMDFSRLPCGTALDIRLHPSSTSGEAGLAAMVTLMQCFISLGGIFMQLDVMDPDLLRDAQAHPEKYPNLVVRISGWSARFGTLAPEWQRMVIEHATGKRES